MDWKKLTDWLREQARAVDYGEITIRIVRHDGQTRDVEKTITTRERIEPGARRE